MFLYTFKASIALAIRSFDPLRGFQRLVRRAHPTSVLIKSLVLERMVLQEWSFKQVPRIFGLRRVGCQQPVSRSNRMPRLLSVFIQNPSSGVGRFFVKLHRQRVKILGWARRKGEVTEPILTADERRRVPLTNHLF